MACYPAYWPWLYTGANFNIRRRGGAMHATGDTDSKQGVLRDMGDGLVVRRATPADRDAVAALNAEVFRERETNEPGEGLAAWTRDLMRGNHPTVSASDVI